MITRMGLLKKKPSWTTEAFRQHWRDHHGALAAQLPGLRRYHQNHVVDQAQRGIQFARGPEQLDGFSQLWFDDVDSMRAAIASPAGQALVADEQHFIGDLRVVAVQQTTVVPPVLPQGGSPAIKRMSLLRRRADVSAERFAHAWQVEHAALVRQMEGVRGYRQNLITERQAPKGTVVGYEQLPVDGIVELWFDSIESIDRIFGCPAGLALMAHAGSFIGEITTTLVEVHAVVDVDPSGAHHGH